MFGIMCLMRKVHTSPVIFIAIASVAFVVTFMILRGVMPSRVNQRGQSNSEAVTGTSQPSATVSFAQTAEGVYILPTADPTYPLQLGPHTVGGVTACERLANLTSCLKERRSDLVKEITEPHASASASIETSCSLILNDLSHIRPQSVSDGCIF